MTNELILAPYRQQIDAIDAALIQLLAQRFAVAQQVATLKKQHNLPARLPQRIAQVQQQAQQWAAEQGVPVALVQHIWQQLIEFTCQYEEQLKVKSI